MKKCPYCAEEIQDQALKCKHCGEWLPKPVVQRNWLPPTLAKKLRDRRMAAQQKKAQKTVFQARLKALAQERKTLRLRECKVCGKLKPTLWIEYTENISYFFERRERTFSAFVCIRCMGVRFLEYELNTLFFTWWGIIGLVVGPAYLAANLIQYGWKLIIYAKHRRKPEPQLPHAE